MPLETHSRLRPTLWRTCRVLANAHRLRILKHLLGCSEQSVDSVAKALKMNRPLASAYLRALNARGLITARRSGRGVYYSAFPDKALPQAGIILEAFREVCGRDTLPLGQVFKTATAFTHPRRELICRSLRSTGSTFIELRSRTRISKWALRRHLKKLLDRKVVNLVSGRYRLTAPEDAFCTTLVKLVLAAPA